MNLEHTASLITNGSVGVIPTDTIYGLVGSALMPEVVERIYTIRARDTSKPLIVLIALLQDLERFGIIPDRRLKSVLEKYWPGPVSVILQIPNERYDYLHRGTNGIAFRLPDKKELIELIIKTGPLVAPSANPEGKPLARAIDEARAYFGDRVDFYVDEGVLGGPSSTLAEYVNGKLRIIRQGAVPIA